LEGAGTKRIISLKDKHLALFGEISRSIDEWFQDSHFQLKAISLIKNPIKTRAKRCGIANFISNVLFKLLKLSEEESGSEGSFIKKDKRGDYNRP
jgi:hypothetical protein